MEKQQGMRDPVPTKPELASDQGGSWQDAGCLHLSLAPGCHLLPPLWLAHPETGFAFSSSPGQGDTGWRQHRGPWAGSREKGPGSPRVRGSWMRPCQAGQGSSLNPNPHRGRVLYPPAAGSNPHAHVVCALTAPREEWKHLEVTCKQAALSVNEEI